ncbi:hypothetical protein [Prescottella subtropica]|uniref:hypothetical protein n=1 Tax=Prescottella subtropica TaxID=2545757 RepID=UPI0010F77296|nr:hypothetical protein [Prescottella subtropica]
MGASAAAVAMLGMGTATAATPVVGAAGSAAPATVSVPPDYQMCGTAFVGAGTGSSNNALPSGARAVGGVDVKGELYSLGASTPSKTLTTTTAADGTYCLTGDSSLVSTITGGGKVVLSVTPTSFAWDNDANPSTPDATVTSKLPYSGTVKLGQFFSRQVAGTNSATGLNVAFN